MSVIDTTEEWLLKLSEELKYLAPKDRKKVIDFYATKISNSLEYGEKEEDILYHLDEPSSIAEKAYASHGEKYLETRRKAIKRKTIFNKIIDSIISLFVLFGGLVVLFLLYNNIFKMFKLIGNLMNSTIVDIIVTDISVISYILIIVIGSIYFVDLIYIILCHFILGKLNYKNDETKRKVLNFTISSFFKNKDPKKKSYLFNTLLITLVVGIFFMIVGLFSHTYIYRSFNNKPGNLETIEYNEIVENINIDAVNGNVIISKSDTNKTYIKKLYEFDKGDTVEYNNKTINIKLNGTDKFDFFDIFTEPSIVYYVYISEDKLNKLTVNGDSIDLSINNKIGNVDVKLETFNSLFINNSIIDEFSIDGYKSNLIVQNSTLDKLKYKSLAGNVKIKNNSSINDCYLEDSSGSIYLYDSMITDLKILNKGCNLTIDKVEGSTLSLEIRTCLNDLSNLVYTNCTFKESTTGKISIKNSKLSHIENDISDSYFLINNVENDDMDIKSVGGLLFIDELKSNKVNIVNSGDLCKSEIGSSNISSFNLTQTRGYISLSDLNIENSMINITSTKKVEFNDVEGSVMNLYLYSVNDAINLNSKKVPNLEIHIKRWDAISYANITNSGKYNFIDDTSEGN